MTDDLAKFSSSVGNCIFSYGVPLAKQMKIEMSCITQDFKIANCLIVLLVFFMLIDISPLTCMCSRWHFVRTVFQTSL